MGKKAARGPYYFYMLEYQKKHKTNYRMEELTTVCAEPWSQLSPRDRVPYEKMAKDRKNEQSGQNQQSVSNASREIYTSLNIPLSLIEKEQSQNAINGVKMKRHILQLVNEKGLKKQIFHFIHFNYFCKTLTNYVPAEVCVLKYSLQNGIEGVMHSFIDPEEIPRGFAYEAKYHTTDTHKSPLPPQAKGDIDFVVINKILDFLRDVNGLPPVFTMPDNIEMTKKILETMLESTQEGAAYSYEPDQIRVYPLPQLLFDMKNVTAAFAKDRLKSIHIAESLLLTDRFDYTNGIACDYHIEVDADRYCSQSSVKRYAFMVSDVCCTDLNIKLVPGQHLPIDADLYMAYASGSSAPPSDTASYLTCSSAAQTGKGSSVTKISAITEPVEMYEYTASDLDTLSNFTSVSQRPPQVGILRPLRPHTNFKKTMEPNDEDEDLADVLNSTNPFAAELYQEKLRSRANSSNYSAGRPLTVAQHKGIQNHPGSVKAASSGKHDTDNDLMSNLSIESFRSGRGRGTLFRKFE